MIFSWSLNYYLSARLHEFYRCRESHILKREFRADRMFAGRNYSSGFALHRLQNRKPNFIGSPEVLAAPEAGSIFCRLETYRLRISMENLV